MHITFLNVGQGDSIILEWKNNHTEKIGIIDCNINDGVNRVTDFLKFRKITAIEFIVLSHPHSDHFSGFLDLLHYIENQNISVDYFLHSCPSEINFLLASRSIRDQRLLHDIFQYAGRLNNNGLIKNYGFVNDLTQIFSLSHDIKMKFSFPNNYCYTKYNKSAFDESSFKNHPAGNFLSTVIQIYNGSWKIIFTADCIFEVFQKLNQLITADTQKLCFVQVSHHGAKSNFNKDFWLYCNRKLNCEKAVISFGENSYGHPSQYVIDTLERYGYHIYATNSYTSQTTSANFGSALNVISKKTTKTNSHGKDVTIDLTSSPCIIS